MDFNAIYKIKKSKSSIFLYADIAYQVSFIAPEILIEFLKVNNFDGVTVSFETLHQTIANYANLVVRDLLKKKMLEKQ